MPEELEGSRVMALTLAAGTRPAGSCPSRRDGHGEPGGHHSKSDPGHPVPVERQDRNTHGHRGVRARTPSVPDPNQPEPLVSAAMNRDGISTVRTLMRTSAGVRPQDLPSVVLLGHAERDTIAERHSEFIGTVPGNKNPPSPFARSSFTDSRHSGV